MEHFGGPLRSIGEALEQGSSTFENSDKVLSLKILKNEPAVFHTLPNTLFSFDMDCVLQPDNEGSEISIDHDIAQEITRILSGEHSTCGILLTSNGMTEVDLAVAKKLITHCVNQLEKNQGDFHSKVDEDKNAEKIAMLVDKIKLAAKGGAVIFDFQYKGTPKGIEITHSENERYKKIMEKVGTAEIAFDATSHDSPQIVILSNGLTKESRENTPYLRAADVVLGKVESDANANLAQELRKATTEAVSLALHPEKITDRMMDDPNFHYAYHAFIDDLVQMGNGIIRLAPDRADALQSRNASDFSNKDATNKEWDNDDIPYSVILDKLMHTENPALTIEHPAPSKKKDAKVDASHNWANATVNRLLEEMEKNPDKPLCWTINGNNHFPTHIGLRQILKKVAEKRMELNKKVDRPVKDIILISGNVARNSPYNEGPVGKLTSPNTRQIRGEKPEAELIHDFLCEDKNISAGFEFIRETASDSTMENLKRTLEELKERNLHYADAICVNTQSGFSGLRSALTPFGWQAKGNMPESLYFINPDWSSAEATGKARSYKAIGRTCIQSLRELKNLTGCFSKRIFNPSVPLPENMVGNFKTCLQKIGIDPDTLSGRQVEDLLDQMNAIAMRANTEKLIGADEDYATAIAAHIERDTARRQQEDLKREDGFVASTTR